MRSPESQARVASSEDLVSLTTTHRASLSERLSRSLLLRALKQLQCGSLTLVDGQQVMRFGGQQPGPDAKIIVQNPAFYSAVLSSGTVGAGEAYMQRYWDTPDLVAVVRVMSANIQATNALDSAWTNLRSLALKGYHWLRANTVAGSRKNIAAHYDLGNDFFPLFLDETMMYSSAVFSHDGMSLQQASEQKLERICRRLNLKASDHLIEIGTGWGGMAIYAARHYGCRVTTTTLSQEQYDYASAWVKREGLEDRITLLLKDYRQLNGEYDKLVSIEMIEAVGHDFYDDYFATCSRLLKPDGLMLIQAITIADQRYDYARTHVDFIQRYIFPGGALPSVSVISQCLRRVTDMQLVGLEEIGLHYAKTLAHWRERFWQAIERVRGCGFDDRFIRMWDFYLAYCEGGFRERVIGTSQLLMAKPAARDLPAPLPL